MLPSAPTRAACRKLRQVLRPRRRSLTKPCVTPPLLRTNRPRPTSPAKPSPSTHPPAGRSPRGAACRWAGAKSPAARSKTTCPRVCAGADEDAPNARSETNLRRPTDSSHEASSSPASASTIAYKTVRHTSAPADEQAASHLSGEAFPVDAPSGWTLAAWRGLPLGWCKITGGTLKNHLPKGLRRRG